MVKNELVSIYQARLKFAFSIINGEILTSLSLLLMGLVVIFFHIWQKCAQ